MYPLPQLASRIRLWLVVLACLGACSKNPVNGKNAFILTSESQEKQLGEQAFDEILRRERVATGSRYSALLQGVGRRIAAVANQPGYEWKFVLIQSQEKNAFCLPGGKVAFYTGILPDFANEAQLATVMGHEVAHATARHAGQRLTLALGMQALALGANIALSGSDNATRQILLQGLGVGLQVGAALPFSRSHESEADEMGLLYLARAGYDPREAVEFWKKFGKDGGPLPEFLSTHPSGPTRVENLNSAMAGALSIYEASSSKIGKGAPLRGVQ